MSFLKAITTRYFTTKRLILSTDTSTRTLIISPLTQMVFVSFVFFIIMGCVALCFMSAKIHSKLDKKNKNLYKILYENQNLKSELVGMLVEIDMINEYLESVNMKDRNKFSIKNLDTKEKDKKIAAAVEKYGINKSPDGSLRKMTFDGLSINNDDSPDLYKSISNSLSNALNVTFTRISERFDIMSNFFNGIVVRTCETRNYGLSGVKNILNKFIKMEGGPFHVANYNSNNCQSFTLTSKMKDFQDIISSDSISRKNVLSKLAKFESVITMIPFGMPIRDTIARIGSGFGVRYDPIRKHQTAMHYGMDFQAHHNAPISATAPGIVIRSGYNGGFGISVDIKHNESGFMTRYGHLSSSVVKVGQRVDRHQVIGYQGSTGRSTGSHLHYEVHLNGTPVNPSQFIAIG